MKIITDEHCTGYRVPGHPERPARVRQSVAFLKTHDDLPLEWLAPGPCDDSQLLRAHCREHLDRLACRADFDLDTPWVERIETYARTSAGAALEALRHARAGAHAFSLMRPPGHHATANHAMGFCYLNNLAVAVLDALATGEPRVAVFDFDVHHGNGTEAILVDHPDVACFSIHQSPCYPGTGTRNVGHNCFNFPVAPFTMRYEYRNTLHRAFEQLLAFKPTLVAVSAGFDAYARDPIAQQTLEAEDFHWIGRLLHDAALPVFSLLEGGYSNDLPKLIHAYLSGLKGR